MRETQRTQGPLSVSARTAGRSASEQVQFARRSPHVPERRRCCSRRSYSWWRSARGSRSATMQLRASFRRSWAVIIAVLALRCLAVMSIHIALQWEKVVVLRFGKIQPYQRTGACTSPFRSSSRLPSSADQRIMVTGFARRGNAHQRPCAHQRGRRAVLDGVGRRKGVRSRWRTTTTPCRWRPRPRCATPSAARACPRWPCAATSSTRNCRRSSRSRHVDVGHHRALGGDPRHRHSRRSLQEAMSAEAQAEREKNARMVLAEVEKDISAMLVDAANVYRGKRAWRCACAPCTCCTRA